MKPNAASVGRFSWLRGHAWLTVTLCGFLGTSLGLAAAHAIGSVDSGALHPAFGRLLPLAVWAATAAGVLVGVLAGLLLVRVG